jgi:hypothetical protein
MIWVAWRQHRAAVLGGLGVLLLVGVALVVLRLAAESAVAELGAAACLRDGMPDATCPPGSIETLADRFSMLLSLLPLLMLALPVLVGALAGAPLFARDYEQRTHLFTLTQSVGRTRWWLVKLLLVGAGLTVAAVCLGFVVAWSQEPLAYMQASPLRTPLFETRGPVVGGYLLLAFSVAATLGLWLRNTVAAIALTVVAYLVLVPALGLLRAHHLPEQSLALPVSASVDSGAAAVPDGSWVLSTEFRDTAGAVVDVRYENCGVDVDACAAEQGATEERISFQPPDRFWPLQLIEAGLATALSAAILLLGRLRLRRRAI